MDAVALIRRLHEHRIWANARLRAACAGLTREALRQPFEIGRGSLWSTLVHLYGAEFVWLEALRGVGNTSLPPDESFGSLEELQVSWIALDRRWRRFLDELTEAKLDLPVHRRGHATPAADVLIHVCTHAQYTTAQGVQMLRRLGVAPEALPDTQMITLSRGAALPPR